MQIMEPKTTLPYGWLKTVDPELYQSDQVPLFGQSPPFPWEEFTQKISKTFGVDNFSCKAGDVQWRGEKELYNDLGDTPFIQSISIASFEGHPHFVMDKEEMQILLAGLITKEISIEPLVFDPELDLAFQRFFSLEVINTLSLVAFDKTLSIHLHQEESTLKEKALCIDLELTLLDRGFSARLLLPPSFVDSWRSHYAEKKLQPQLPTALLSKIETVLHVEIGKVQLPKETIESLKPGDLVVLDECTVDPGAQKGAASLSLQGIPRFKGTIEKGKITLTEVPTHPKRP